MCDKNIQYVTFYTSRKTQCFNIAFVDALFSPLITGFALAPLLELGRQIDTMVAGDKLPHAFWSLLLWGVPWCVITCTIWIVLWHRYTKIPDDR